MESSLNLLDDMHCARWLAMLGGAFAHRILVCVLCHKFVAESRQGRIPLFCGREEGTEAGDLLGAPGRTTRSKDATRGS